MTQFQSLSQITPIHLNINTIPIALSLVHNLTHKHQHVSDATIYNHKNGLVISPSLLECQYRAVANSQRLPQTHHQKRRYPETQTQYTKSGHPPAPVTRNTSSKHPFQQPRHRPARKTQTQNHRLFVRLLPLPKTRSQWRNACGDAQRPATIPHVPLAHRKSTHRSRPAQIWCPRYVGRHATRC